MSNFVPRIFDIPDVATSRQWMARYTPDKTFKSNPLVGIEVELEQVPGDLGSVPSGWYTEEDSSLRNRGFEYITKPAPAAIVPHMLTALYDYLGKRGAFTLRTSIHVHLNMQDCTEEEVKNLITLYTLFEDQFYNFAGRSRWKNIYCVPMKCVGQFIGLQYFTLPQLVRYWHKYYGMNLIPLSKYGTLEFRHMPGTWDVERLTLWLKMIVSLKEFVKSSDRQFQRTIQSLTANEFPGFAEKVFPPECIKLFKFEYVDTHAAINRAKSTYLNTLHIARVTEATVETHKQFIKKYGHLFEKAA